MSNTSASDDTDGVSDASVTDTDADDDCLHSVVVTYEGAADRQTLYPPAASDTERLTHWLTADADAFERLDEMR
jgi:hypothetical protein